MPRLSLYRPGLHFKHRSAALLPSSSLKRPCPRVGRRFDSVQHLLYCTCPWGKECNLNFHSLKMIQRGSAYSAPCGRGIPSRGQSLQVARSVAVPYRLGGHPSHVVAPGLFVSQPNISLHELLAQLTYTTYITAVLILCFAL